MNMKTLFTSLAIAAGVYAQAQMITTIAGTGSGTYAGDGGAATAASLYNPVGTAVDAAGNVYVADLSNNRIRMISAATGVITTIAGTGAAGFGGDGGPASAAILASPTGVCVDPAGNLYIADYANNRIRKVTAISGQVTPSCTITTIAGTGTYGYNTNTNPLLTNFSGPYSVEMDRNTNLYIADAGNNRVRMISAFSGNISSIAGTGAAGSTGDGLAATSALLNRPTDIAFDTLGNIYIADFNNNRVRVILASDSKIYAYAGNGTAGYAGDGSAASLAHLNKPVNLAFDGANNLLYISDFGNNRVRMVNRSNFVIKTIIGTGTGAGTSTANYAGDGGPDTLAEVSGPSGLALDGAGNLYLADDYNNRVRKVCLNRTAITTSGNHSICFGTTTTLTAHGAGTYTWSANAGNATTSTVSLGPTATTGYTISGTSFGCSMMATTTVTVNSLPNNGVTVSNTVLTAMATPATYQWIDCNMHTAISGQTSQSYTATVAGSYAVVLTNNGCTDTSTCRVITFTGVEELSAGLARLRIYPNPSKGSFTIETSITGTQQVQVCDVTGNEVLSREINGTSVIDAGTLPGGVYMVSISGSRGKTACRLVLME